MKFSIIIPSYNNAGYLKRCLGSLPASSPSVQIIVVDDGSTDNTEEVLSLLKERDPGIEVLSKENGGVSSARNMGLAAATGDYVIFLDADDMLSPGVVTGRLSGEIFSQDIVVMRSFAASERYPWKGVFEEGRPYSGHDLMEAGYIRGSVCGCLFRRTFLQEKKAAFCESLTMGEDTVFFAGLLAGGAVVTFCDTRLYEVTQRNESASRHYDDSFLPRYSKTLLAIRENVRDRRIADNTILAVLFAAVNVAIKMGKSPGEVLEWVNVRSVLPLDPESFSRNGLIVRVLNRSFTVFFYIKKLKDSLIG